jgi:hypothetical protein
MKETFTETVDDLQYQKALIDQTKEIDPQTNLAVNDLRTITVTRQRDIINVRIVPRLSVVQNELNHETS